MLTTLRPVSPPPVAHARGPRRAALVAGGALGGALVCTALLVTHLEMVYGAVLAGVVSLILVSHRRRRETQRALARAAASERQYAESFHSSPIPLARSSLVDHRFTDVNQAFADLVGWSREELIGQLPAALGLDAGRHRESLAAQVQQTGRIRNFATTVRRKDGQIRDVIVSVDELRVGADAQALMTVMDRTDGKRTEAALRTTSENLREFAMNAGDVFWMATETRSEILYVSAAYEKLWGRSCTSLYRAPLSWRDAVHVEDRGRVDEVLGRPLPADGYEHEFRIVRPDGETRWIRSKVFAVRDPGGKTLRIAGVAADITKSRSLEEQLRQMQKMEALGMLAGGVAHDFNNLLTVISSCSGMLAETIQTGSSERELVDDIESAVKRATALTRQLLAFSQKQVAQPTALDVGAVVSDTAGILRRASGANIPVELELEPELPGVRIDHGCLVQVLLNLVVNARDAMPRGGKIVIAARSVEVSSVGRAVMLTIADTGCGIPDEVRTRMFEPFFTTKERGKGTGMGLAIVNGIVIQAGGKVELESKLGVGTTFRLLLPIDQARPAAPTVTTAPVGQGLESILVVDDDESVRRSASRALRVRGYRVIEAVDGATALRMLADQPFDLLLTDVMMPGMRGSELAQLARQQDGELKVLFMSGCTDDVALQQDGVELIDKPFRVGALTTKVRQVLDAPGPTRTPGSRRLG